MTRLLLDWRPSAAPGRASQAPGRLLRPLPRTVPPYQDETLTSYQRRLAAANHLDIYHHLRLHLNEHNASLANPDDLAALTGQPVTALLYALPELREYSPDKPQDRPHGQAHDLALAGRTRAFADVTEQRPACRRCTAGRGITGEVLRWVRHDQNVCLQHRLWIGPDVIAPREQVDLTDLPDVVHAQRRHSNLIRRRGQAVVHAAFRDAVTILRQAVQPTAATGRLARITGARPSAEPHPWLPLLTYPETVALASLLAQPRWRHLAATNSSDDAPAALRTETQRETGIHHRLPGTRRDPLDAWWKAQRPRRGYKQSHPELHAYAATVSLERWPKRNLPQKVETTPS